jgi:hypothetical protein
MHEERSPTNDSQEDADDDEEEDPDVGQIGGLRHGDPCPYAHVIFDVRVVDGADIRSVRHLAEVPRVKPELVHQLLAISPGDGKDGKPVLRLPSPFIVEVPQRRRRRWRLMRGIGGPVEDEGPQGIRPGRGKESPGTLCCYPRRDGNEIEVGWRKVGFPDSTIRDVLADIKQAVAVRGEVRDIQ